MKLFSGILLLIISVLAEVQTQRNWQDDNVYSNGRDMLPYDDRIYFPGKTNEDEVNIKRLNNALSSNNYFINENHSNRIDDVELLPANSRRPDSNLNSIRDVKPQVTTSSPRRTSTISNTVREVNNRRKTSDTNRNVNENSSSSLLTRLIDSVRNTSNKSDDQRTTTTTSSTNGNRRTPDSTAESTSLVAAAVALISSRLRICEKKYAEFIQRIFPEETDTASDAKDSEFNGRVLAAPGEYPHMTALGFRSKNGIVDYKCGGSLISERFVITAAHCTNITGQQPDKVRIGDLNLKIEENYLEPQIREIKRIYVHPNYKTTSFYDDIALLELSEEVELTEFVRPIRLWTEATIPFTTAYAMGYGATDFARERTNRLTNLNMTLVPNDVCNRQMPKTPETERGIIESQICAQDFELNRDTCQGDSGGPLQLNIKGKRRQNRLHYQLIGITSYGLFCRSSYPSVYTRVYSYLDWIERIVWREDFY
ncbi:hypothetical protein DOY81_008156 [Sarcophaga bullata]|nr:hypothetical protein DOY81_008156 [Sarcophaga bullata]